MDFGSQIRKFLSDSANTVSNYFGNTANAVGHEVQQLPQQVGNVVNSFTQPQIQSPVPQQQTLAPQQPNWLQNISSFGQNLLNGAKPFITGQNPYIGLNNPVQQIENVGNAAKGYFDPNNVGSTDNPTPNFWTTPVAQGLGKAQQFIESPTSTQIVPTITPFKGNGIPQSIGNSIANLPGGIVNTIVGQGVIDPSLDIGQNIGRAIAGREPLQYDQAKSPLTRLGYELAGQINPDSVADFGTKTNIPQVVGNVAEAVMPPLTAYTGGKAKAVINPETEQIASKLAQPVWKTIVNGATQGAKVGTVFGALQGFASSRNITNPFQYALNVLGNTALGTATGTIAGGTINPALEFIGSVRGAVQKDNPSLSPTEVNNKTITYLRDRAGRFAGVSDIKDAFTPSGKLHPTVAGDIPVNQGGQTIGWMDRIDHAVGVDKNARASIGLSIRDVSKYPLPEEQSTEQGVTPPEVSKVSQDYPNLTQKGQFLMKQYDESGQLPNKSSLLKTASENGIEVPEVKQMTKQQKIDVLTQLKEKGSTYEVNPQGTKSALRAPKINTTMEQQPTTGNFEQEMNNNSPFPDIQDKSTIEQKRENLGLREVLNRNPIDSSGTPISNEPPTGLRDQYKAIYDELNSQTPNDYGTGRQAVKVVEGREAAGRVLGDRLQAQIKADLPNEADRTILRNYLDGSITLKDVPKNVQEVATQIRPITDLAFRLRQAANPDIQAVSEYITRNPISEPRGEGGQRIGKPLSVTSRENFHRDIAKFENLNTGEEHIGTTDTLGLRPNGEKGQYEDAAGNTYIAKKAGITEIEESGVQQYQKDAADILGKYVASTLKVKERFGFIDALRRSDTYKEDVIPSGVRAPSSFKETNVKGLEGYLVSPKMYKQLQAFAKNIPDTPIGLKVWDGVANVLRRSIFYNFITHPMNQLVNALTGSGAVKGNLGPLGMARLVKNIPGAISDVMTKSDNYIAYKKAGAILDEMNGHGESLTQKIASKLLNNKEIGSKVGGIIDWANPVSAVYKANNKIVGWSDDVLRTALYKTLQDGGMPLDKAVQLGDKFMVDYGNTSAFEKNVTNRFLIFYPYLKGLAGGLGQSFRHPGALVNLGIILAGLSAYQAGLQQITGNKNARARFPGLAGFVRDLAEAPGQVINHEIPNIVASHVQPMLAEGIEQTTNKARLNDLFKQSAQTIHDPLLSKNSNLEDRASHALTGLVAPAQPLEKIAGGKKTLAEIGLNQLGISLPHLKGYEAAPNLPNNPVNSPNAQKGTGLDSYLASQDVLNHADPKLQELNDQLKAYKAMDPNDPNKKMLEGELLSSFPQLLALQRQMAQAGATASGNPIDPLMSGNTNMTTAQALERYNSLPEKDPFRKQLLLDHPELQQLLADRSTFYKNNPIPAGNSQFTFDAGPQPSQRVQDLLAQKNFTDPEVQKYLNDRTAYDNQKLTKLGLSPVNSFGNLPFQEASYQKGVAQRRNSSLFRTLSRKVKSQHSLSIKSSKPKKGKSLTVKTPAISSKLLSLKGKPFSIRTKF